MTFFGLGITIAGGTSTRPALFGKKPPMGYVACSPLLCGHKGQSSRSRWPRAADRTSVAVRGSEAHLNRYGSSQSVPPKHHRYANR
jgi:hypothetical protein